MAMLQREWACSGLGATAATEQSHADAGKRLVHSKPLFAVGGENKQTFVYSGLRPPLLLSSARISNINKPSNHQREGRLEHQALLPRSPSQASPLAAILPRDDGSSMTCICRVWGCCQGQKHQVSQPPGIFLEDLWDEGDCVFVYTLKGWNPARCCTRGQHKVSWFVPAADEAVQPIPRANTLSTIVMQRCLD
jgi:hypothetical protein